MYSAVSYLFSMLLVKFIHGFACGGNSLVLLLYKILFMNLLQCVHSTTDGIWAVSR